MNIKNISKGFTVASLGAAVGGVLAAIVFWPIKKEKPRPLSQKEVRDLVNDMNKHGREDNHV